MVFFYIYAALSVLLTTLLALNVSRLRIRHQIGNGDGGNKQLRGAIRAHMNTFEHAIPFALLILAMAGLELGSITLASYSLGFILVRIAHAYAMLAPNFKLRQYSAGITYFFEASGCITVLANLEFG